MTHVEPILPNQTDSHCSDPHWFALIVRQARVQTLSKEKLIEYINDDSNKLRSVSDEDAASDPVEERTPLLLSSAVTSWTVNQQKGVPTSTCTMHITPDVDIARLVAPGDWVMLWGFDNAADHHRILQRVRYIIGAGIGGGIGAAMEGANGPSDGLRFIGVCNGPKMSMAVTNPEVGTIQTHHELTAVGFQAMESRVYYTPAHEQFLGESSADGSGVVALQMSELTDLSSQGVPVSIRRLTDIFMRNFLGRGPGAIQRTSQGVATVVTPEGFEDAALGVTTPNQMFAIPRTVALLLGVQPPRTRPSFFDDILHRHVGVAHPSSPQSLPDARVVPRYLDEPKGFYVPQMIMFDNTSVWELITRYSNQPVNEVFCSLRLVEDGRVMPCVTIRQNPFSSKVIAGALRSKDGQASDMASPFIDLPRWRLDKALVTGAHLGSSDSLRCNYLKFAGVDVYQEAQDNNTSLVAETLSPPLLDLADIRRSGLRSQMIQSQVAIGLAAQELNQILSGSATLPPGKIERFFTALLTDIYMTAHLKWSGTIQAHGIQGPVTIGENLEFDDVVYQIEGRTDQASVDPMSGRKTWRTSFSVSSGISARTETAADDIYPYQQEADPRASDVGVVAPEHGRSVTSEMRDPTLQGLLPFSEAEQSLRAEIKPKKKAQILMDEYDWMLGLTPRNLTGSR